MNKKQAALLCLLVPGLLCGFTAVAQFGGWTNDWTKPTSDNWEEPYWSLGMLPGGDQAAVAIRNSGWKAVAIGGNTTLHYASSLSLNNLLIEAPADSHNQLLLNWAGHGVPLTVRSNLMVGVNGSLVGHYSAVKGGNLCLKAPAAFSEASVITFNNIVVGSNSPASLTLTNSSLTAGTVTLGPSNLLVQSGGAVTISNLFLSQGSMAHVASGTLTASNMHIVMSSGEAQGELVVDSGSLIIHKIGMNGGTIRQKGGDVVISSIYNGNLSRYLTLEGYSYILSEGSLRSGEVSLGTYDPAIGGATGSFHQYGGIHTNSGIWVSGFQRHFREPHGLGYYILHGGLLVTTNVSISYGTFYQSGGTNYAQHLLIGGAGSYRLSGGDLVTLTTSISTVDCIQTGFFQDGGSHIIQSPVALGNWVRYSMSGGTVSAPLITVGPAAELYLSGGTANFGAVILQQGSLRVEGGPQDLGKLQVLEGSASTCSGEQLPGGATVYAGATNYPMLLRFEDSREVFWSGRLFILNWSTNHFGHGSDHIFIGTNSQGLRPDQLARLMFVRPNGSPTNFSAVLLPTGEVVPGALYDDTVFIYNYIITNGTVTITGIYGSGGEAIIPGTINNLPVTGIGNSAFSFQSSLFRVTIPDTVTSVGSYAFAFCKSLNIVTIGNSVAYIGSAAFYNCTNLSNVYFRGNAPDHGSGVFSSASPTVYYLPGTTDWGSTFAGRPTAAWFLPGPVILSFGPSFGVHSNQFGFVISWATNVPVVVDACTNLSRAAWLPVSTNTLTLGSSYFGDPQWINHPTRLYRVRSP